MDVLIMIVIAIFVIAGVYVGFHASQHQDDAKPHLILGIEILDRQTIHSKQTIAASQIQQ